MRPKISSSVGRVSGVNSPTAAAFRAIVSRSSPRPSSATSDRKSTRLNSSHSQISYAVFCLKKKKRGIKSQLDTKLEKLEKTDKGVVVIGKTSKGEDVKLQAEMLLVAVGRMPFTEGLGLESTKIKVEKGFIKVNEFQQTDEKSVYAIGDVVPTPLLAHLASKEGVVAVEYLAGKNPRPINLRLVPNCTYCDPEIGSVGLSEAKACDAGYDVKVGKFPFSASGKARIIGEEEGFVKVVSEKKYDEILGVHIIGPHATELIAEACVAMQLESTAEELGRTMHAHPTVSEAVMEAAEGVHDMTIHI